MADGMCASILLECPPARLGAFPELAKISEVRSTSDQKFLFGATGSENPDIGLQA
jgi:hypothetical protein